MLALVGDEDALAEANEGFVGKVLPLGFSSQAQGAIGRGFGAGVTRGNMAGGFAAVGPDKLSRGPNEIPEVRWRLKSDTADAAEGNPVIFAFENQLKHGAETRIGIGNPGKGFIIEFALGFGSGVESARTQFGGSGELAANEVLERFHEQADPFERFAEDQRSELGFKNAGTQRFTIDHRLEDLSKNNSVRVNAGDDLQLGESFGPVAEDTMQLKKKNAQLGIFGVGTDFVL